jgi:hypothetical protein
LKISEDEHSRLAGYSDHQISKAALLPMYAMVKKGAIYQINRRVAK